MTHSECKEFHAREWFIGLLCGFVLVVLAVMMPFMEFTADWHLQAIKHNAAHYDSKTGAFTWNQ